jgi:hypothetical protein
MIGVNIILVFRQLVQCKLESIFLSLLSLSPGIKRTLLATGQFISRHGSRHYGTPQDSSTAILLRGFSWQSIRRICLSGPDLNHYKKPLLVMTSTLRLPIGLDRIAVVTEY